MRTPPRIVVIHTSPATVELFARLLRERFAGVRLSNILDDSILPELRDNGGDLEAVAPRWQRYAVTARELGADVILNACSSIGELCQPVARSVGLPIVRVDARLAHEAVARGRRIAVVATLRSTLRPTCDLLRATAASSATASTVEAAFADGAYDALINGDRATHDERVANAMRTGAAQADVVVLAQASMAGVLPRLTLEERAKCLASPVFAVEDVARALGQGIGAAR